MVVIFTTVVVDPARRNDLAAEVVGWLQRTAGERHAATTYEFMLSATDPARLHYFQSWPDDETFEAWNASPAHHDAVFRRPGTALDAWAVRYDGCTGATELRP